MWYYSGSVINNIKQCPNDAVGFTYKIQSLDTNKFYIGKKNLFFERNKPLTKKELSEELALKKPGKKKTKKLVITESDWKSYFGSQTELKNDVKNYGDAGFYREILEFAFSKKQLTYLEIKYQILQGVLETDKSYNDNILGKFFKKDLYI